MFSDWVVRGWFICMCGLHWRAMFRGELLIVADHCGVVHSRNKARCPAVCQSDAVRCMNQMCLWKSSFSVIYGQTSIYTVFLHQWQLQILHLNLSSIYLGLCDTYSNYMFHSLDRQLFTCFLLSCFLQNNTGFWLVKTAFLWLLTSTTFYIGS